ncbi:2-dehydro-3-deoxygluconokinase [Planctomycetes bacterium MalM25]|nr:2-dehydro-3-deoxygluconokinase [Planctomycetes bacterium MalM25]
MPSRSQSLIVGLGESLFDCFPDREVLGGAPLNVALHANALLGLVGGRGVVATRIGRDELGERLLRELGDRGLDTSFVQIDERLPTGRVDVLLDSAGDATYQFLTPSAWDALELDAPLTELARSCDAVVFGTLGQRDKASREAIQSFLLDAPMAIRLFDVNLRQDFYSAEIIDRSLRLASAAKFNEDELTIVARLLGLDPELKVGQSTAFFLKRYDLDWLALTRGPRGTLLVAQDRHHAGEEATFPQDSKADTVGAGDACSAGLLYGSLRGWPQEKTATLANRLGAYVASRPGATPKLPADLLAEAGVQSQ